MKRLASAIMVLFLLCGCGKENTQLHRAMALREALAKSSSSFTAQITADYGDKLYTFSVGCTADLQGNVKFIVTAPETISGISGELTASSGFLTFDDAALAFPLLADGEVSPVSAPWLLITALRGGYLASVGTEGESVRLTVYDSYADDALQLDIWLNDQDLPQRAEIIWQGRRVLSMDVKDFCFV